MKGTAVGRSVPAETVIARLGQEIAALTQRAVVAEALLAAAEAELAEATETPDP